MKLLRIGYTKRTFTPRQLIKEIILGTSIGHEILNIVRQYYSLRNGKTIVSIRIPLLDEEIAKVAKEGSKPETQDANFLDLSLILPVFHEIKKIKVNIRSEVITPPVSKATEFVSIIRYSPAICSNITVSDIIREPLSLVSLVREALLNSIKTIPKAEFHEIETIISKIVDREVRLNIKPVAILLNYVSQPRIIFHSAYDVHSKSFSAEVIVKTRSIIYRTVEHEIFGEELDPLECIFGFSPTKVLDMPLLVLAEKPEHSKYLSKYEYIEYLKRIFREIYRVRVGGLPRPLDVRIGFEDIKFDVRADRAISMINLDYIKGRKDGQADIMVYISDRLRELYSQNFGFLIIYGKNVENKIVMLPKVFRYIKIRIKEDERPFKLASLMWGRVTDFSSIAVEALNDSRLDLDAYGVSLERYFYDKMTNLLSDSKLVLLVEPSRVSEERLDGESLLHYAVKVFIVKYLLESEGLSPNDIHTEYRIGDVVLDIFARHPEHGDLAVEVETLYGTTLPILKLKKTIESRLTKGLKLWVVIPNPQLTIYFREILYLYRVYKVRYPKIIGFFTLDIESNKLIPLKEFAEKMKEITGNQLDS